MADLTLDTDVLIVGGGPVGVILACDLIQMGVAVRIIDKAPYFDADDPHSRGILIWPRTLELLRRIGVSDTLAARGYRTPGVGYYSGRKRLGTARLSSLSDSPHNYLLTLPQRKTEVVLRERLHELGGHVEHGVELVDFKDTGDYVSSRLDSTNGETTTVSSRWVVACDGPASTVRSLLGVEFNGDPIDVTYVIGDAPVQGKIPNDAQYYYTRDGVLALVPLKDGHFRIAANIPHRTDDQGHPTQQEIQAVLDKRVPGTRVGTPDWTRAFRPRLGLASSMRRGRIFIAGDAAHVISPAGGQGLNVGVQDSINLAWKIAGVVSGRWDEKILDSYEAERKPAAERMSRTTAGQARFALQKSTWPILKRDTVFLAGRAAGLLRRMLVPLLAQTDVSYGELATTPFVWRRSKIIGHGERVPLFAGQPLSDGRPVLDLERYSVLLWPGTDSHRPAQDWVREAERLAKGAGDSFAIIDGANLDAKNRGLLRRGLGDEAAIFVIRPDGHLERRAQPSELVATMTNLMHFSQPMASGDHNPIPTGRNQS